MAPYRLTSASRTYEGLRDLVVQTKQAETAFARYGYNFLRQCVGMGQGTINRYYKRRSGPGAASVEESYVSPLDTFYIVPPLVDSPAPISKGTELTQTQAWYKRLEYQPEQGWLNAYAKIVRVRFASESGRLRYATQFYVSTRPLIQVSTHNPPEQVRQDCARICSGRMAVNALIAEALRKGHNIAYDNAAVFGELYDAWQARGLGNHSGIPLPLAESLGVPIVDGIAQRPAALDEAAG